jgi:hypothetical protein
MLNCGMLPSTLVMLRPRVAVNRFPGLNLMEVIPKFVWFVAPSLRYTPTGKRCA